METRVVRGSRRKAVWMLVGSIVLFAGDIWLYLDGNRDWRVYLGFVLFGLLCVPVFIMLIMRPSELSLSAEGFRIRNSLRPMRLRRWRGIEALVLWSPPRGRIEFIGWRLAAEDPDSSRMSRLNRSMLGVDGTLPAMWEIPPKELLALMQTYHRAAMGPQSDDPEAEL